MRNAVSAPLSGTTMRSIQYYAWDVRMGPPRDRAISFLQELSVCQCTDLEISAVPCLLARSTRRLPMAPTSRHCGTTQRRTQQTLSKQYSSRSIHERISSSSRGTSKGVSRVFRNHANNAQVLRSFGLQQSIGARSHTILAKYRITRPQAVTASPFMRSKTPVHDCTNTYSDSSTNVSTYHNSDRSHFWPSSAAYSTEFSKKEWHI
mmetsp:Transcript_5223/g.12562  ORF Transcript_5223/g.12562 Transcript_5223/m.12562 type:complete len:206 (-) Transcript_5223:2578-3195(-)